MGVLVFTQEVLIFCIIQNKVLLFLFVLVGSSGLLYCLVVVVGRSMIVLVRCCNSLVGFRSWLSWLCQILVVGCVGWMSWLVGLDGFSSQWYWMDVMAGWIRWFYVVVGGIGWMSWLVGLDGFSCWLYWMDVMAGWSRWFQQLVVLVGCQIACIDWL